MIGNIIRRTLRPEISKLNWACTYHCNQRCQFCNIWMAGLKRHPEDELTINEIQTVLRRNNIMWLSITGGEPFQRWDIEELLPAVARHVDVLSIVTNGCAPRRIERAIWGAMQAHPGLKLTVSVSVLGSRNQHDTVTRTPGSYASAIETLHRLNSIKNGQLVLLVENMISPITGPPELPIRGIKVLRNYYQEAPYYGTADSVSVDDRRPGDRLSWKPNTSNIIHNLFLARQRSGRPTQCVAAEYACTIGPYGDIYPCLPLAPKHRLGNIRENHFLSSYMTKEVKAMARECKQCWTPCEAYATIIFRPWRLLS